MRIISTFHDYYDVVQATGQDQTLIYNRRPEKMDVAECPFPVMRSSFWFFHLARKQLDIHQHIIGFCGKIYPAVTLTHIESKKSSICHNIEEVDRFVEGHFHKKFIAQYRDGLSRRRLRKNDTLRKVIVDFFADCAAKKDAFAAWFVEKGCPVFVATLAESRRWTYHRKYECQIILNGCLKDLEFYRVFDPYSAFQEIALFFGGMAVPLKEIPQVPDKIMVGIKGFDQWSFRKPPQT